MSLFLHIQVTDAVLDRARAGDMAAYELIYSALSKPVYTLIRRLVARPAVAEELLQDVFVEILGKVHTYNGDGSFAGWVRSIAVTKALMYLRSPWNRRLMPDGANVIALQESEANMESMECWSSGLERALNLLPDLGRSIVWLHDVEGYTHGEIAELFGRTTSFSKSQLARAHEQLRALLEPQTGGLECTPVSRN